MTKNTADQIWGSPPMSGDIVIDQYMIVDQWWTDKPIRRSFRVISRVTGQVTEMSENDGPWVEVDIQ